MKRGFTLIEIIVVIAIIGILGSIVMSRVNTAREKAQTTRVKTDLRSIRQAIDIMAIDTGKLPTLGATKNDDDECVYSGTGNELYVDTDDAGIGSTDGNFPNWRGPYITPVPLDPWGNSYIYDSDYECTAAPLASGCEDHSGDTVSVVHSSGPNGSAFNAYDSDDIVLVICAE